MTYGYCTYHGILCDYEGNYNCIDCPHNTDEDVEWFRQGKVLRFIQDEEHTESEDKK